MLPKLEFPRLARFVVDTPLAEYSKAARMPRTVGPLPKHGSIVQQYYLDSFGHRRPFDPALALSDALAYQYYV